jgi:bifunctional UDP-N-acetylglucosamine pyrophosphorylase/glucosamine-1-phosphate N-acetyltransferase
MAPIKDKNFLDFLGKPLIQHQIEFLMRNGLGEIIVVGGKHNLAELRNLCGKLSKKIVVVEQKNLEMGMRGAILAAKGLIKNEPVLIFSGNDVVEKSALELVIRAWRAGKAESFILAKTVSRYFPGGYLKVDKKNLISAIIEKPEPGKEPSNLVNLVVHIHTNPAKLFKYLEKFGEKNVDLYEDAMTAMIKDGAKMQAIPYSGFWQPIKYPWHVHNVFKFLFGLAKKTRAKSAKIAKNAIINGDVIIAEKAVIFDGAVINGPAYIGKNTIIATNALVRESHVGENCIIGFSTEVARSYLGSDVWTHTNYIGDSVIGNNVSFGSGAVTGNLRFDEQNIHVDIDGNRVDTQTNKFGLICGDNVRVGINTSLMPGIRIGGNSFVGAGIIVPENIPENSYVRASVELKISENKVKISKESREEMRERLKR